MLRTLSKRRLTQPAKPRSVSPGAQQLRSHHRRQGQRHDAGNDHGARKGKCELPEQRPGQAALNTDWRIHRRQGDRHGDDRADQLAGRVLGRLKRRLAHMKVALDVFHHHDGVIDHQADREHDRQQGQQVDGEAEHQHQEDGANQRNRDGDDRNEH